LISNTCYACFPSVLLILNYCSRSSPGGSDEDDTAGEEEEEDGDESEVEAADKDSEDDEFEDYEEFDDEGGDGEEGTEDDESSTFRHMTGKDVNQEIKKGVCVRNQLSESTNFANKSPLLHQIS